MVSFTPSLKRNNRSPRKKKTCVCSYGLIDCMTNGWSLSGWIHRATETERFVSASEREFLCALNPPETRREFLFRSEIQNHLTPHTTAPNFSCPTFAFVLFPISSFLFSSSFLVCSNGHRSVSQSSGRPLAPFGPLARHRRRGWPDRDQHTSTTERKQRR